jgi:hypothetical protein
VAIAGLILNVSRVNGDTALFFFGSRVNRVEGTLFRKASIG